LGRVERIRVGRGEERMTVERRAGREWVAREVSLRADSRSVGALLRRLSEAEVHSFREGPGPVTGEEPLHFVVGLQEGEEELVVGDRIPGTSLRHCRSTGRESPFQVAQWVVDSLLVSTHSLIDRRIVRPRFSLGQWFFFQTSRDTFTLTREGTGGWSVTEEERGHCEAPVVRAFLLNWERLEGDPLALPSEGWGSGERMFRLETAEETLEVWERKEGEEFLARRGGEDGALLLGEEAKILLEVWGEEFLDAPPLPAFLREATFLRVEYPGLLLEAVKGGEEWRIRKPFAARGEQAVFERLLESLSEVRHVRWSPEGDLPPPVVTLGVGNGVADALLRVSPFSSPQYLSLPRWEGQFEIAGDRALVIPSGLNEWMEP
jgi:hypothetical protein